MRGEHHNFYTISDTIHKYYGRKDNVKTAILLPHKLYEIFFFIFWILGTL